MTPGRKQVLATLILLTLLAVYALLKIFL